jgi:hypothetical protein
MSTFLKIVSVVVTLAVLVFVSGLTGFLFTLWPTSWPDQTLRVTDSEITLLQRLRAEPKFYADAKQFYPGAIDETTRVRCEALVNSLLSELIVSIKTTPRKSHVLSNLKVTLSSANALDSEDQDRLASYLEEALRVLEIDSSNELINVWGYGFPYGWFTRSNHAERPAPLR